MSVCPLKFSNAHNRGNTDGQPRTTYGNLSAYNVPYIVVPDSFATEKKIPPNAISAVICNGQMYYAIMGDTNGNVPQVIGEASWLMGQTCFPDEDLSGGNAHSSNDVLCIIIPHRETNIDILFYKEFTGVNVTDITDYPGLVTLGDQKFTELVNALNSSGNLPGSTSIATSSSIPFYLTFIPIILAATLCM